MNGNERAKGVVDAVNLFSFFPSIYTSSTKNILTRNIYRSTDHYHLLGQLKDVSVCECAPNDNERRHLKLFAMSEMARTLVRASSHLISRVPYISLNLI